ncbi:hypothetical protein PV08_07447 [Exophiala spinifera]|uniref:Uncharacterized protein n=1 Tax=Exophiala spinifera TaxID=91928 RepID=A0A0D2B6W9_9EURO|nr:uncharacterized protein PV08_07447 [Exophiala spinifera]KIW14663.1 hypothetical protein PV08_07447 [Exophiala spinifera]
MAEYMKEVVQQPSDASTPPTTSAPIDPSAYPTHRLNGIKAGKRSVQLLVNTGNQLFDAENIECDDFGWQSFGNWEGETLLKVVDILQQRQPSASTPAGNDNSKFAKHGSGQRLGPGRTLADIGKE